jgi:PAS domain S-box-containing protein
LTALQNGTFGKFRIEYALDSMTDAFVLLDREYRIVYVNPATERVTRIRGGDLIGHSHWEVFPTFVGSEVEWRYREAMRTGESQHFQHHYVGEGHDFWLDIHAYPGEAGLAIYCHDVTQHERKLAESARIDRAYQAALSNIPDLVYVFGLDHRFIYANQALLSLWGRTWDDAIGKNCLELGYPDWHAAMHDREIEQFVATRQPIRGEVPFTGTQGNRIYEYIFVPVIGTRGEVESVAGTTRDVTEHRQAEEVVHSERTRLVELLQQAPAFMAMLRGPDHIFEVTNPFYQELIGGRNVIGKPVREGIPESVEQGFVKLLDGVYQSGEPFTAYGYAIDIARYAGQPLERRYLNFVYQPMRAADGTVSGIIALGVDVTEARKTQAALLQNEKLAAAGRLAASIAHEINNPLEAMINLLFLIEGDDTLTPDTRKFLDMAQSELARVSQIATQSLRFYRQATNPARAKIGAILESVAELYERRFRSTDVTLERRYSTSEPVMVFIGELRQVVTNMVGNSLKRHEPRDHAAHLRSVLQHQGRHGHRPWALGQQRDY